MIIYFKHNYSLLNCSIVKVGIDVVINFFDDNRITKIERKIY